MRPCTHPDPSYFPSARMTCLESELHRSRHESPSGWISLCAERSAWQLVNTLLFGLIESRAAEREKEKEGGGGRRGGKKKGREGGRKQGRLHQTFRTHNLKSRGSSLKYKAHSGLYPQRVAAESSEMAELGSSHQCPPRPQNC